MSATHMCSKRVQITVVIMDAVVQGALSVEAGHQLTMAEIRAMIHIMVLLREPLAIGATLALPLQKSGIIPQLHCLRFLHVLRPIPLGGFR